MNALIRFPWLLVAIPLLEIFILIKVGGHIGAIPTVALVIVTAVLGINLIRYQGMTTFFRVKGMVDDGQLPALELLEGLVLLVAGAFLLTPGFVTDTLAFLALIPALRRRVLRRMIERGVVSGVGPGARQGQAGAGGNTIEGEFRRHDE
jgi:UPF0716 protein FxsA